MSNRHLIKANELRIGNLVRLRNSDIETNIDLIDALDPNEIWIHLEGNGLKNKIDKIEPVRITKEWILKFGLADGLTIGQHIYYFVSPISLHRKQTSGDTRHQFLANVEFVHDLQNLMFALTGRELEIIEK